MLLLVALLLVVASLVLLVLGFVRDAMVYIYVEMLLAALAGIALIVSARVSRRRAIRAAGTADVDEGPSSVSPGEEQMPSDAAGDTTPEQLSDPSTERPTPSA